MPARRVSYRRPTLTAWLIALVVALIASVVALTTTESEATTSTPTAAAAAGDDQIAPGLERRFERSGGAAQDFWVSFDERADTSGARGIEDWGRRGQYVLDQLRDTAATSQADTIALLDATGVDYTAYWIVNAIRIDAGDYALAQALAAQPGVDRVFAPVAYEQPAPVDQRLVGARPGPNAESAVAWGVQNIKADRVWEQYGVRGDGIVVANIDTGVQFDHPALIGAYRGYDAATGRFDNDYNWFDATGKGSVYPNDGHGHGTHTMGTMVGDDGAANRIGAAPGATWIAANGCCPSDQALIDSAQWLLAPTRVDGSDPDPVMRPNIVNNSWGTELPTNDPFMEDVLLAWADAGIFGVWANGNNGKLGCESSGSPGSRTLNYSVGAYDSTNTIADFSSRGPGQDGEIKPNISAPGVNVRSSLPGNNYGVLEGTSMAAPHVSAAVALLWSADPSLIGEIDATRQLLDDTAVDVPDDSCGGTDDDNNVYGEGRLDALALVEATVQGERGTVTGTVAHDGTGEPVPGATVRLVAGDLVRSARTDDAGAYVASIPAGDYTATVAAFGYEPETIMITVTAGQTTTTDVQLVAVEGHTVIGTVVDKRTGRGIPGARVTLAGSRFAATSANDGTFTLNHVPGPARYLVTIDAGGCTTGPVRRNVQVEDDLALGRIVVARHLDRHAGPVGWWGPPYGYSCIVEPSRWIVGDTPIERPPLGGSTPVRMPFPFTYFGKTYRTAHVSVTLSDLSFWTLDGKVRHGLSAYQPWYQLAPESRILSKTRGKAPNRTFTIEYRDVLIPYTDNHLSFEITFHESGDIVYAYKDIDPSDLVERGSKADIGFQEQSRDGRSATGSVFSYANREPVLSDRYQIHFSLPPNAVVAGEVMDKTTRQPVPNATVDLYDRYDNRIRRMRTGPQGRYRLQVFTGRPYRVEVVDPPGYRSRSVKQIKVGKPRSVLHVQHVLGSGRFSVNADAVTVRPGKPATVRITNNGRTKLNWRSTAALPYLDRPPAGSQLAITRLSNTVVLGVEEVRGSLWVSGFVSGEGFRLFEVTMDGEPTGATVDLAKVAAATDTPAAVLAPGDLAWVPSRGWLCMSFVAPAEVDDLVCVQPDENQVVARISTGFGGQVVEQGLAYDAAGDRFFVVGGHTNGGFQHRIHTLAGVGRPDPGARLRTCTIPRQLQGLAWNPTSRTLWSTSIRAGRLPNDTAMRQVDPVTCAETAVIGADPAVGVANTGLDLDADGDFLATFGFGLRANTIAGNDPIHPRLHWLRVSTTSGALKPHQSQQIRISVDWAKVPDGVTRVRLVLRGNGGARPQVVIPVTLRR